jgi:hypothetical protein
MMTLGVVHAMARTLVVADCFSRGDTNETGQLFTPHSPLLLENAII